MYSYIDIINIIFSGDEDEYKKIPDKDKSKFSFNINRRFAIGHPEFACKLSLIKQSPHIIVDVWFRYLKSIYNGRTPKWQFTKKETPIKNNLKDVVKFTERSKELYITKNKIKESDFNVAIHFSPTEMSLELNNIENYLKHIDKNKK